MNGWMLQKKSSLSRVWQDFCPTFPRTAKDDLAELKRKHSLNCKWRVVNDKGVVVYE